MARIREGVTAARALYCLPGGDFDLRAMVVDMYDDVPTPSVAVLRKDMEAQGKDGTALYEEAIAPHWEGLTREERRGELERQLRLSLRFRDATRGRTRIGRQLVIAAALAEAKVNVLACAFDAAYGTDLSELAYLNPERLLR